MRPIDFVVFDGDSEPNTPAYKVAEAMETPIAIRGPDGEYEVMSYYLGDEGMIIDIRRKE